MKIRTIYNFAFEGDRYIKMKNQFDNNNKYFDFICKITAVPAISEKRGIRYQFIINFIFSFPVFFLYFFSLYYYIWYSAYNRKESNIDFLLDFFTAFINCTYIVVTWCTYFIQGESIKEILHNLNNINYFGNYAFMDKGTGIKKTFFIFLLLAFYITNYFISWLFFSDNICSYLAKTFSYFISWIHTSLLISYVSNIKNYFWKINREISLTAKDILLKKRIIQIVGFHRNLVILSKNMNESLTLYILSVLVLNFLGIICFSKKFSKIVKQITSIKYGIVMSLSLLFWIGLMLLVVTLFLRIWVNTRHEVCRIFSW